MAERIMGLDYGSKTVGVAVSDALHLTAQGIEKMCIRDRVCEAHFCSCQASRISYASIQTAEAVWVEA